MSSKSEKSTTCNCDINLMSLEEWKNHNPRTISSNPEAECPHFCRMREGVIKRLDKDDTLENESLGSGFAAMVNLGEALIGIAVDSFKKIQTEIRIRIKNCIKQADLKR